MTAKKQSRFILSLGGVALPLLAAMPALAQCPPGFSNMNGRCDLTRECPYGMIKQGAQCVSTSACAADSRNLNGLCVKMTSSPDASSARSGDARTSAPATDQKQQASALVGASAGGKQRMGISRRPHYDFNGDGKTDVLSKSENDYFVGFLGPVVPRWGQSFVDTLLVHLEGWNVSATGDFDNDGKSDILWSRQDGVNIDYVVSLIDGTTILSSTLVASVPAEWQVVGTGDFDHDGKADLLWRNTTTGDTVVSLMNGASIQSSVFIGRIPLDWKIIGIGDFDGDGKADLLWQNPSTNDYVVSLMNGPAIASSTLIANVAVWSVAGIGDFDGDGKKDLLWYHAPTERLTISFMNGAAIANSVTLPFGATRPPRERRA